jgi:hypothetical protein
MGQSYICLPDCYCIYDCSPSGNDPQQHDRDDSLTRPRQFFTANGTEKRMLALPNELLDRISAPPTALTFTRWL